MASTPTPKPSAVSELYASKCASCHGDQLTGGEMAPPLAGPEFMSNWNGLTAGDLFDRIRTTMPANKPGSLSREANADILAYMSRTANSPPAAPTSAGHRSPEADQNRSRKPTKK